MAFQNTNNQRLHEMKFTEKQRKDLDNLIETYHAGISSAMVEDDKVVIYAKNGYSLEIICDGLTFEFYITIKYHNRVNNEPYLYFDNALQRIKEWIIEQVGTQTYNDLYECLEYATREHIRAVAELQEQHKQDIVNILKHYELYKVQ